MARLIEFYIPNTFRRKVGWMSLLRRGRVIEFGSRIPTKAMRMQKGTPTLHSAVIGGIGLELTDPDRFILQRADELQWD